MEIDDCAEGSRPKNPAPHFGHPEEFHRSYLESGAMARCKCESSSARPNEFCWCNMLQLRLRSFALAGGRTGRCGASASGG